MAARALAGSGRLDRGADAEVTGILLANAGVIAVLMTALWGLSLVLRDASIVDPFWGLGFAVVGWTSAVVAGSLGTEGAVLVALTTVWGLRLAGISPGGTPKGEDCYARCAALGRALLAVSLARLSLQGALLDGLAAAVLARPGPGRKARVARGRGDRDVGRGTVLRVRRGRSARPLQGGCRK